jgi:adenosine deaminase
MIEAGLLVSINSDDPAYFGGYIGDNYRETQAALGLEDVTLVELARNSIQSSFLDATRKTVLLAEIDAVSAGDEG